MNGVCSCAVYSTGSSTCSNNVSIGRLVSCGASIRSLFVVIKVTDENVGVVLVVKDLEGGYVGKSDVTVADVRHEHIINGAY